MNEKQPQLAKGYYQHYKGNHYQVIDLARHSETEQWLVVYRPLYGDPNSDRGLWVRPYEMFVENVIKDGQSIPRFAPLSGEALAQVIVQEALRDQQ